jgi:AraC-like DNA-binding protein
MHTRVRAGTATPEWLEDQFFAVAKAMLSIRSRAKKHAARVPARKLSTRLELYKRLLRGKDFLDSFHAEAVQLDQAARAACLSRYHFHRLFREVFGETPNLYLQRKRLARARELLKTTDRTITAISLDVGFESSTSFSALFRRNFGCSPREFRSLFFLKGATQ